MQITITVNSLKELQEVMDRLVILDAGEPEQGEAKKRRAGRIDREAVAAALGQGFTNKEIAELLNIGYATACKIVKEIKEGKA